jgi:MFS family permease
VRCASAGRGTGSPLCRPRCLKRKTAWEVVDLAEASISKAAAVETSELTTHGKKAIAGAFFGLGVDFYDIYLPTVALTPAVVYFIPKNLPVQTAATLSFIIFAVTLIGRPIGAIIFGHFGDVIGRRRTTMMAVGGFGVMTLLIALLPGYTTWGYVAIALLILLRFIDGVFMGGEYTSANPLALEACPKRLRGLVGGIIQAAYPIAYVAISLTVAVLLQLVPAAKLDSPYVQWGWRIPFFIGSALAFIFLAFYRRVEESRLWEAEGRTTRTKAPLAELFSGQNFKRLAQVFLMMTGLWFGVQVAISFTPTLLQVVLKEPAKGVTNGLLVANIVLVAAYLVLALLGQALGRRFMLILSGAWTAVLGTLFYYWMTANAAAKGSLLVTMALYTVALCLVISPWGIVTTYINERFATGIRASGYGIGYSLAVIIPGLAPLYLPWLAKAMPYIYTPLVLLVVGGVLQVVGAWLGPETRHVEMASTIEPVSATEPREPRRRIVPA